MPSDSEVEPTVELVVASDEPTGSSSDCDRFRLCRSRNWHLIDAQSFPAYHWGITIRAGIFLAAPRLVEIVIGLIVLRFPPNAIDRWVVLLGVGLALCALLSTVLISRPIHRQLDLQSNTPELLSRLMATDWIRNLFEFSRTALYVWAQSRLINNRRAFGGGAV